MGLTTQPWPRAALGLLATKKEKKREGDERERTRNKHFCFLGAAFPFTLDAAFFYKLLPTTWGLKPLWKIVLMVGPL